MLLDHDDPAPVQCENPQGRSPFLLIGDHAGKAIPARLGDLGLPPGELERHIGWDIGVAALGVRLSAMLDAPFVHQAYSRLVIDCNRDHAAADLIAPVSDGTAVPANAGLSADDRAERIAAIHEPYHGAIAARIAARDATLLVALHSFTPRMNGIDRPWQIGVLHDRGDLRLAHAFLAHLRTLPGMTVGDNEPYRMDGIDHSVPRHAYPGPLPYVEIEVRQDLIADPDGVEAYAGILYDALEAAASAMPAR